MTAGPGRGDHPPAASIRRIAGSLVETTELAGVAMYELVRVGHAGLLGEVVRTMEGTATLQVYEETRGLRLGEPVVATDAPLEAELGPGLLGSVLDGVGRPLHALGEADDVFVPHGVHRPTLEPDRTWIFEPRVEKGATVQPGDILGTVRELESFEHRILVPPGRSGRLEAVTDGSVSLDDPIARLDDGTSLHLAHRWPVRRRRPFAQRRPTRRPFVTGQRVLDFLFPAAEGGSVALPGGFGTGKTVVEQSLAKYGDADVVVFVACGERGNEIAELLAEFPELEDPRTGRPLMERTVLVVNTSNMPVAAREASLYLGITIGEYFRDMGYRVAVMADSVSRWAEALRELGARMQEMPGEEGYPTYLANRLGALSERAGRVETSGSPSREGALTFIGSVSPPGGDLSEPVTQAALRVAGAMWALDPDRAHRRSFPAVDLELSYSLFVDDMRSWMEEAGHEGWRQLREDILDLLQRARDLHDLSSLIGRDSLQDPERFVLEAAELLEEVLLVQNAFDPVDASSTLDKTLELARLCYEVYRRGAETIQEGTPLEDVPIRGIRQALVALRQSETWEEKVDEVEASIRSLEPMDESPKGGGGET